MKTGKTDFPQLNVLKTKSTPDGRRGKDQAEPRPTAKSEQPASEERSQLQRLLQRE